MYVATERETSDNTEATRFSQCAHDQRRRLEAEDCNSIRCAQLISGGRRRIRPPCTVPRSRSPHNVLHSPSIYICDRHCTYVRTSKLAINISIFHLGSYTRRARILPRRGAVGPTHFRSHCPRPPGPSCELTCSLCSSGIVLQV